MKINGTAPTEGMSYEVETEDVTSYIASNPDYVSSLLGTDIGIKSLQPKLDSHFTKSLETWKANNLDKIVEDRVSALYPNETPQAKQMRELQKQIDTINGEKNSAVMATKTLNIMSEEGVPNSFAKFLQGADEATTRANIQDFKNEFNLALNGSVDSKFKQFAHQPQTQTESAKAVTTDVSKMSYADRMNLYQTNPKEYERLFS